MADEEIVRSARQHAELGERYMPQTNERRRELYRLNRDKQLARNREYKDNHRAQIAAWMKDYRKVYYSEHRDAIRQMVRDYKERTRNSIPHIKRRLLSFARHRAKRLGLPFDLSFDDLDVTTHCPVLGVPFRFGRGNDIAQTPTLDRIVPKLGYVKGNIQVISHRANTLKRDATVEELELLVSYMRRVTR